MLASNKSLENKKKIVLNGLFVWLCGLIMLYLLKQSFNINSIRVAYEYPFDGLPKYLQIANIIITCFLEELIFRLYLSFKETHISISIASLVFLYGYDGRSIFYQTSIKPYAIQLLIAMVLGAGILYIFRKMKYRQRCLSKKSYILVIIVSSIICACFHLGNYGQLQIDLWKEYLFAVAPLFFIGYLCGYYRVFLGFSVGCLTHILYDIIAFLPVLI